MRFQTVRSELEAEHKSYLLSTLEAIFQLILNILILKEETAHSGAGHGSEGWSVLVPHMWSSGGHYVTLLQDKSLSYYKQVHYLVYF